MLDGSVSRVRLPQVRYKRNRDLWWRLWYLTKPQVRKGDGLQDALRELEHRKERIMVEGENRIKLWCEVSTEVNVADVGRTEIPLEGSRMEKSLKWSSPYYLLQVSFGLCSP